MKRILSLLSLGALCAVLTSTVPASASNWTTTGAPASSLTFSIILGDPNGPPSEDGGADGGYVILDSLGPQSVDGTADADVLTVLGDGTLTFNSSSLVVADGTLNLDLSALFGQPPGSALIDASLIGVGMDLNSTAIPVVGTNWDLDTLPPTSFNLSLNQGSLLLTSPTGTLVAIGETDPLVIDLSTDPVTVTLADLTGTGIGGTASSSLINMTIPAANIDIGAGLLGSPGALFLQIGGSINVVPVVVPEPSSVVLLGMGLAGLVAYGYRRRK